jgi:hypothetical protein
VLSLEATWNKFLDQIEQRGWVWQYVHADDGAGGYEPFPFYCYRVGLAAKGLSDLIAIGLNPRVATDAGDELISCALWAGGQPFTLNTVLPDVFKTAGPCWSRSRKSTLQTAASLPWALPMRRRNLFRLSSCSSLTKAGASRLRMVPTPPSLRCNQC